MEYRTLGKSGLIVSEIGLGCWQLASTAWGTQDSTDAQRIVETALDQACTFFDTAPADGPADFSVAARRPAVAASLKRLQTDYLDVLLVHNPPPEFLNRGRSGLYAALRLKILLFDSFPAPSKPDPSPKAPKITLYASPLDGSRLVLVRLDGRRYQVRVQQLWHLRTGVLPRLG